MATLTHPLHHIPGNDLDRRLRRPRRHFSIVGRIIANLRFADDIDGLAGEEKEVANLAERLDKASTAYGISGSSVL